MARLSTLTILCLASQLAAQPASQTIAFDPIADQIFGISPFAIAAQASSGLPVHLNSSPPAVCRNSGNLVMLLGLGTCSVVASQAGSASFSAATSVTRSFVVNASKPSGTLALAVGSPIGLNPASYPAVPSSVAVGDFNGDGVKDLAVGSYFGSITVWLGDGSGGFALSGGTPFQQSTSFPAPVFVVVGDFNGDGLQDIAAANSNPASVTVLLGNGLGGFTEAVGSPFALSDGPESIVAGDFNGDGIQDLATANHDSNSVSVLLGNGSGGFTPAAGGPFPTGASPAAIAVGDFNGDRIQDLVTANYSGSSLTVLLGDGAGGFAEATGSPVAVVGAPESVVVGDFNGDGIQDLATANDFSLTVSVFLGNGSGGFTPAGAGPISLGATPDFLMAGDFNGDGIEDLAVLNQLTGSQYDNMVTVLLGDGTGGFQAAAGAAFTVGNDPVYAAVADFNRDGIEDLAVISSGDENLSILLGAQAATNGVLSTTSQASIAIGQPVPLSLVVSDAGTGFAAPTGTATFLDRGTILGTASETGGSFAFTAGNLAAGSHTLTALYSGDARSEGSISNGITIQVAGLTAQTITFGPLGAVTMPAGSFALTATASSGLPVSFASTTAGACTVSGSTVTPLAAGTCSITATQAGNATYAAAASVVQSFTINPAGGGSGGGGGGSPPPGGGSPVTVLPASVTISAAAGGPPGTQAVTLSYQTFTQGAPSFSSNLNTNQGQGWLSVSPASGTMTQASLSGLLYTYTATVTISADPAGLVSGNTYTGEVNFSSSGTIVTVPVNVSIASLPLPEPTGGIANAASAGQATPGVVGLGTYIAIYGKSLAGSGSPSATVLPLPTTLNGTQVTLGGKPMPLLYAAGGQINALVPQGLTAGNSYPLVVTTGTVHSAPVILAVKELQPGIYTVDTSGSGAGIVTNALTGQLINSSNPAHASDYLVVYGTGLGAVAGSNGEAAPADGAAAPDDVLYSTTARVTATIGGVNAPVLFSGLTATFAGLYQVNIQVPAGVAAGTAVPLVITATDSQTGAAANSNSVTIAVQ